MNDKKNSLPIISLVLGILSFIIIMSATPFDTDMIGFATFLGIIALVIAVISIFNSNYKKVCAIICIAFCITSFVIKSSLDNTRNSSPTYNNEKNNQTTNTHSITNPSTNTPSSHTPSTNMPSTNTTLKNYQQIYNEYSQKLINAGPTSSINEMAKICNEGVSKMAQYMYSASGTDGQYATYQSWVDKLYDVYINNCR